MLAQPFFMRKAQTFPSPGFVITQSLCNFRHQFFRYGKVTFSSLHSQPNRLRRKHRSEERRGGTEC